MGRRPVPTLSQLEASGMSTYEWHPGGRLYQGILVWRDREIERALERSLRALFGRHLARLRRFFEARRVPSRSRAAQVAGLAPR